MFSKEEREAAKAERMFVPTERVMGAYAEYKKLNERKKRVEKEMEGPKKIVADYVRQRGAKNLLDPESGAKIVTFAEVESTSYDMEKIAEYIGADKMKQFEIKKSSTRLTIR